MQEGDAFSFRADARCLVDELNAGLRASGEGAVQIVDRKTDVMDAGTALGEELPDRGSGLIGGEEFDERLTGR